MSMCSKTLNAATNNKWKESKQQIIPTFYMILFKYKHSFNEMFKIATDSIYTTDAVRERQRENEVWRWGIGTSSGAVECGQAIGMSSAKLHVMSVRHANI